MKDKKSSKHSDVILGIDPGTRVSGYGVIGHNDREMTLLDYGCIRPPAGYQLSSRYLVLFESVETLIQEFSPTALVVETQFVHKNVQSAIKLGMARGTVMIAAKRSGIPIYEYPPAVAKRAVVGNGRASKWQVQGMVQLLLKLSAPPKPEDAADALALAICHSQMAEHLRASKEV